MPTIATLDTIDPTTLAEVTGGASPAARAIQALNQATAATKALAQSFTPGTGPSAIASVLPGSASAPGQALLSSWQSSGIGSAAPAGSPTTTPALPTTK